MNLTTCEIAYLAGIIDGEGSLGVAKIRTPRNYGKKIYWTYSLRLNITSTNPELIKWLREKCGVRVYNHTRRVLGNRQIAFATVFTKNQTIEVLKLTHKYLIIKKPQADIILSEWPLKKKKRNCPELREKIRNKLLKLNLRGKTPEETERERAEIAFGHATVRTTNIQ